MIIVDSHCHLDMLSKDCKIDLDEVVKRAKQNDVQYLQTICTKLENIDDILEIADKYKNVFASVGIHPNEAKQNIDPNTLIKLAQHPKVIGLGETGLDYFYHKQKSQQKIQRDSFEAHIVASQDNKLPVIIHARDAEEDIFNILSEHKKYQEFPGLIHCFTASKEFAIKMLDLDIYISFSGIVTFKNAQSIRDIVKYIPCNRILVETDAPYLAPMPHRGKTNEPSYTKYTLECIAELKGYSIEQAAHDTTENFFNLFSKAQKG